MFVETDRALWRRVRKICLCTILLRDRLIKGQSITLYVMWASKKLTSLESSYKITSKATVMSTKRPFDLKYFLLSMSSLLFDKLFWHIGQNHSFFDIYPYNFSVQLDKKSLVRQIILQSVPWWSKRSAFSFNEQVEYWRLRFLSGFAPLRLKDVLTYQHHGLLFGTLGTWRVLHNFGNLVVRQHFLSLLQCEIQSKRKMERCETVQKFRQFRERFYVRSRVSQSFLQVLSTKCSLAYSRKIAYKTSYVTTSSTCRANKGFLNKEKVAHFLKSISITMKFFYCQETAKCAIRGLAKTNRLGRG